MLGKRLLTALVLLPLVLLGIYQLSLPALQGVMCLLVLWCGLEWIQLIPLTISWMKWGYLGLLIALIWLCRSIFPWWLGVNMLLWAGAFLAVVSYPASMRVWGRPLIVASVGLIFLAILPTLLVHLARQSGGRDWVVYFLALVWAADIGAYFAGKAFGKRHLIPNVSPGKTVEGCVGGLLLTLGVAGCGYVFLQGQGLLTWMILALAVFVVSVLGDLFMSMLKRRCHLKDTGSCLPGHGGVLDRLDSTIATLPLFYVGLSFLERLY